MSTPGHRVDAPGAPSPPDLDHTGHATDMDDERTFYPTNNALAMGCFFSLLIWASLGAAIFFLSGCGAVPVDKAPTTEESEVVAQPAMTYTVELPKK